MDANTPPIPKLSDAALHPHVQKMVTSRLLQMARPKVQELLNQHPEIMSVVGETKREQKKRHLKLVQEEAQKFEHERVPLTQEITADIKRQWELFTKEYTQQGKATERVEAVRALYDVAFGKGMKSWLKKNHIHAISDPAFPRLLTMLGDVCTANSAYDTKEKQSHALNRALNVSLAMQWIGFRDAAAPERAEAADKPISHDTRTKILSTPEGKMFSDALLALNNEYIGAMVTLVTKERGLFKHFPNLTPEHMQSAAIKIFYDTLFRFRDKGNSFSNKVVGDIRLLLMKEPVSEHKKSIKEVSLTSAPDDDSGDRLEKFADTSSPTAADVAESKESSVVFNEKLSHILDEREIFILEHRYGLNGKPKMTNIEIAGALGLSTRTITNTVERSLKKIRRSYPRAHLIEKEPPEAPEVESIPNRLAGRMSDARSKIRSYFTEDGNPIPFSEITAATGIHATTLHRLMGQYARHRCTPEDMSEENRIALQRFLTNDLQKPWEEAVRFQSDFINLRKLLGIKSSAPWKDKITAQPNGVEPAQNAINPPNLDQNQKKINEVRHKIRDCFFTTDPRDKFLNIDGKRYLSLGEIHDETRISTPLLSLIMGDGKTSALLETNALKEKNKSILSDFLRRDLKRPEDEIKKFQELFDELRALTGYDATRQLPWARRMRTNQQGSATNER